MAWFWTDDLARAALESGLVSGESVQGWIDHPVAIAGADGADALLVAAAELGLVADPTEAAAGVA